MASFGHCDADPVAQSSVSHGAAVGRAAFGLNGRRRRRQDKFSQSVFQTRDDTDSDERGVDYSDQAAAGSRGSIGHRFYSNIDCPVTRLRHSRKNEGSEGGQLVEVGVPADGRAGGRTHERTNDAVDPIGEGGGGGIIQILPRLNGARGTSFDFGSLDGAWAT